MTVQVGFLPLGTAHLQVLRQQRPQILDERPAAAQIHLEQQRLALRAPGRGRAPPADRADFNGNPRSYKQYARSRAPRPAGPRTGRSGTKRAWSLECRRAPPSVKGCSLSSSRPRSKGKPRALSTSTDKERWRATVHLRFSGGGAGSACTSMASSLMRPGSLRDSALNMVSISGCRNARHEAVHQRIVGREPTCLPEQRCLVAHQVHHLFQVWRQQFGSCLRLFGLDLS